MQHAKRMVLVDEKFLENIWRKESSSWKRPTDQKAKSLLNHELKSDLDDSSSIPDDLKAKNHQYHLNRFLHTTRQLPILQQSLEPDVEKVDVPKADVKKLAVKKADVKLKAEPTRRRRSKRKSKKVQWEEWN